MEGQQSPTNDFSLACALVNGQPSGLSLSPADFVRFTAPKRASADHSKLMDLRLKV